MATCIMCRVRAGRQYIVVHTVSVEQTHGWLVLNELAAPLGNSARRSS